MLRRGYPDIPEHISKIGMIQARRKGYADSTRFYPLQITVPPYSVLCDVQGRFENPRPAPIPQGLKYNTTANSPSTSQQDNAGLGIISLIRGSDVVDLNAEVNDLTKASIFSLPRFDPEKEMRMLQNLWSKRGSLVVPPLILCSPRHLQSPSLATGSCQERSFFESDSDDDEDEDYSKR
jgi:hypothetical protein